MTLEKSGTDKALYGVAFGDATHGWAVGDGVIVTTDKRGGNWRLQKSGVDDLHRVLSTHGVGVKSTVTLLRAGKKVELDIVPEELADWMKD